jgi:hypothetical protein
LNQSTSSFLPSFLHPGVSKGVAASNTTPRLLPSGPKSLDVVRYLLVVAAMILILAAVFEEDAVQLLEVVFRRRNGFEALESHFHRIGVTCHFLVIAACE